MINTPVCSKRVGYFVLSAILMILFITPSVSANILDSAYDLGINLFTSKEAINKYDIRIEAEKTTIFENTCDGYLPIDVTNLEEKEKGFTMDLSFQDNSCQVKWYEEYKWVEKIRHECEYEVLEDYYNETTGLTSDAKIVTCEYVDKGYYGWVKIEKKVKEKYESNPLKLKKNTKQNYQAFVNCQCGKTIKYSIFTNTKEGTTELDPTIESSLGDWKGTTRQLTITDNWMNISGTDLDGDFFSVGWGDGLRRDYGVITIDKLEGEIAAVDESQDLITNVTMEGGSDVTATGGHRGYVKASGTLVNITRASGVTCTTARLMDAGLNELATASFSGDVATFNYQLTADLKYFFRCDSGGASYTRKYQSSAAPYYPQAMGDLVFDAADRADMTNATDGFQNIFGFGVDFSVTGADSYIQVDVCYSEDNITFGSCEGNVSTGTNLANATARYMNYSVNETRSATTVTPGIFNISIEYTEISNIPTIPTNLNPVDFTNFTENTNINFNWTNSTDIDEDTITYNFEIYNISSPLLTGDSLAVHGETLTDEGSTTSALGFLITMNRSVRLTKVIVGDVVTATNCNVTDAGLNLLQQSAITDKNATFELDLDAGKDYFVFCDSNGNSYTRGLAATAGYPFVNQDLNIIAKFDSTALPPENATDIIPNILMIETTGGLFDIFHQEIGIAETATPTSFTLPFLTLDGDYFWRVQANDGMDNSSFSSPISLIIDALPPLTLVVNPTNTSFNTLNQSLDVICQDLGSSCANHQYSINNAVNVSFTPNTTFLASEGSNTLDYCAEDSFGHLNCTVVSFIVDSISPLIEIDYPKNTSYSTDQTELNISVFDMFLDTCWYSTNLGVTNTTITCGNNVTGLSSGDGSINWFAYVNDTYNNQNQTNVIFTVDAAPPQLNITYPLNITYNSIQTALNYTAFDITTELDTCWYSTNLGVTNTTITCGNNVTGLSSGQGDVQWYLYVNDTRGNNNQTSVEYFVDSINPTIYVESPLNTTYGYRGIDLNVTGTDANIDSYFYSLDWGANISFDPNITVTVTNGMRTIALYVNDTANRIAQSIISFYANDTTILPFTLLLNSTTMEGTKETYYANITFNPVSIADINVTFNYNNTNYTAVRTNLTNNHIKFETTFNAPAVSVSTSKTLYAYVDEFFINGSKGGNYTTSATQTVNPFDLYYCETGGNASSYMAYNFSFKEEYNDTFLNQSDIRANFNIWTTDLLVNSSILIDKTNIPDLPVCVSPPDYVFHVDATMEYEKAGYVKRFYYLDNDEISANSTTNIALYLLDDDDDTHITFTIADNLLSAVENALLYVQKYYPALDSHKTVAMGRTGDEGEAIIPLKLYDTIYRFIVTEGGATTHTSGNTQLDAVTYTIITQQIAWGDQVKEFDDVNYELTWDNDTETATLTWSVSSLESRSFCLKCTHLTPQGGSILFDGCEDSVSGSLSCSLPDDGEYTAVFYGKGSHKAIDLLNIVKGQVRVLAGKLGLDGVIYTVLVSGTLGAIGVAAGSAILAILGTIIGVIAMSVIGFVDIGFGIIVGLVIVGMIALWRVQR